MFNFPSDFDVDAYEAWLSEIDSADEAAIADHVAREEYNLNLMYA